MAELLRDDAVVSFENEELVLVDAEDREVGHLSKSACHDGSGLRHRAFSIFVFDKAGDVLLQKRSRGKRLWGGYWANSCCSHPRRGETMALATRRRLREELGLECALEFVFKFEYQAGFRGIGAEHELCWVYVGTATAPVRANRNEIEAWRFVSPAALDSEVADHPERFTPWLKLEWRRLREEFGARLPLPASESR
ncbi:MAG TPA: isopentenyl-diphosphate Delta-isomerase [Caldimonas sp.]|nr:isopentenyl-diphosphate Delta-isomerase [Caldimonas sp.]